MSCLGETLLALQGAKILQHPFPCIGSFNFDNKFSLYSLHLSYYCIYSCKLSFFSSFASLFFAFILTLCSCVYFLGFVFLSIFYSCKLSPFSSFACLLCFAFISSLCSCVCFLDCFLDFFQFLSINSLAYVLCLACTVISSHKMSSILAVCDNLTNFSQGVNQVK